MMELSTDCTGSVEQKIKAIWHIESICASKVYAQCIFQISGTLHIDGCEGCGFSKKFRVETSGHMEKPMGCIGH